MPGKTLPRRRPSTAALDPGSSTPPPPPAPMSRSQIIGCIGGIAAATLLLALVFGLAANWMVNRELGLPGWRYWSSIWSSSPTKSEPATAPLDAPTSASDAKVSAWVAAEGFVRSRLKSPATASFGGISEPQLPENCVLDTGNGTYCVRGFVDSQNDFGATVRSQFILQVRDAGDKWLLDSIVLE